MYRVFLFGEVGSGKSTICASLCYYLLEINGLSIEPNFDNINGTNYFYKHWINNLRKKIFPKKTEPNDFIKIDLGIENNEIGERFGVTFYEASGEDTNKVMPTDEDHLNLNPKVEKWLMQSDVIIAVIQAMHTVRERNNLHQFLAYLRYRNKFDIPIALVISKWDLIDSVPNSVMNIEKYLELNIPESRNSLQSQAFKNSASIFSYSIGEVCRNCDEFSQEEAKIDKINHDRGAKELARWIINGRRALFEKTRN